VAARPIEAVPAAIIRRGGGMSGVGLAPRPRCGGGSCFGGKVELRTEKLRASRKDDNDLYCATMVTKGQTVCFPIIRLLINKNNLLGRGCKAKLGHNHFMISTKKKLQVT
jgi:hypothetical protein